MNLIAIQYIMEQLIEQTCSDNLRLYRNDRDCCIETDDGETFLAYINEFGCITLNSDLITLNLRNCKQNIVKESLIFYGGHLIQEEAYRLRISYADIIGVLKPDGYLDVMYLQYLLDTFLTMAKEYRRNLK